MSGSLLSSKGQLQRVALKFPVTLDRGFDEEILIAVFHRWIQENKFSSRLLIDVADYRHVPHGPGVMLIAHETHYSLDHGGTGTGILIAQKRDQPGPASQRLREALWDALRTLSFFESEELGFTVPFESFELTVMSRLAALRTEADSAALAKELKQSLEAVFAGGIQEIEEIGESGDPLRVRVQLSQGQKSAECLARLRYEPEST